MRRLPLALIRSCVPSSAVIRVTPLLVISVLTDRLFGQALEYSLGLLQSAALGFPKRTAAFPVKRLAHEDLCVNLPGCPRTKREPDLR